MDKADHLAVLAEALKDVDPAKLPHGLEQYKRFGPKTVRAILAVRDIVMDDPKMDGCKFRIGMTSDLKSQEASDREAGCVAFSAIHESSDMDEIRIVEADVRLNFLWHFPGRCLNKGDYRQESLKPGVTNYVYVTCLGESAPAPPGKV